MNYKPNLTKSLKRIAAAAILMAAGAAVPVQAQTHMAKHHARLIYMHKSLARRQASSAALVAASPYRRPTPLDSYLQYKVYSVNELVKQVSSNPRLIHIYARTFNKPDKYVLHYISNYVQESYIPETAYYTVYCVRKNGLIYPTKQKMIKGTKVFALRNGTPVMKWLCGNPLSKYLPVVYPAPPAKTTVKDVVQLLPAESEQEVVPAEVPVVAPATPIHVLPTAATRIITSAGSHGISPAYLGLAAVPFLHTHHSGSPSSELALSTLPPKSPSSPVFPLKPTPPPSPSSSGQQLYPTPPGSPSPVPELGTGPAVALGLLPLALLAWFATMRKGVRNA